MNSYWASVLTTGTILAIAAVGLQITIRSGQFSVIHAALMGLGGYLAGYAAVDWEVGYLRGLALSTLAGAVVGVLVSALVMRLGGLTLGIATLAIGEGLVIVANTFFPGKAEGLIGVPLETTLPIALAFLALVLLVATRLRATSSALAIVASGDDPVAGQSVGISSTAVRLWGFGIGGAIAGLAGGLNVYFLGLIVPADLGFALEVQLLLFVVIGGRATVWGPVLGAYAITIGTELLRVATLDRYWILGLLLIIIILSRPEGVLLRRPLRFGGTQWSALAESARNARSRLSRAGT